MEIRMTEEQAQAESRAPIENQKNPVAPQQKKKASWTNTILWMLSMMLLVNVIIAIIAYFMFFYNK